MKEKDNDIYLYIIYDGRYRYNKERATVYCTEDTLKEAEYMKRRHFNDGVIVEYKMAEDGSYEETGKTWG